MTIYTTMDKAVKVISKTATPYAVDGNAGITYRLVIMDGDDVEKVKVVDENAYNKFEKGKDYILTGQVNVNNARCGEWKVNGFVKL